jgi:hypothetical protein
VYYVDDNGACPGDGSEAAPFCLIQDAIDAVGPQGAGTIWIAPGAGIGYAEDLSIVDGQTIALGGSGVAPSVLNPVADGATSTLTVAGASTVVYLEHLLLRVSGEGPAIDVSAGTLVGTRLQLRQNAGGAIALTDGANLSLVNSIVGSISPFATALSVTESTADLLHVTLVGSSAPALSCDAPLSVTLRNTIVLEAWIGPELECDEAVLVNSATEAEVGDFTTNGPNWFVSLGASDFHLTPEGAAAFDGLGQWNTGDPLTDIDGDPRPGVDGAPDFPGADVPQ